MIATEAGQPFPADFPKDLYSNLNRVRRSLEEGEQIEWVTDSQTNRTVLTRTKRKGLVLAHRETYEAEVNIVGRVEELDAKKKTGTLRGLDQAAISFVFDDPFFSDLKEVLGSPVLHVRIRGVGVFDGNDRLVSIPTIEQLEELPHFELLAAIENLASLSAGWLEGNGVAPKGDDLAWLGNEVGKSFLESLEYPSVVPTEEGQVVREWIPPHARIELEINFAAQALELYATNVTTGTFEEASFAREQWGEAFAKVGTLLQA